MPLHAPRRSYRSALVVCRVVTFILLCFCGFLCGGACVLLAFLLFEPSEIAVIWPPSPIEVVLLGLGSLVGGGLGIWAGVCSEMEWRKG